MSPSPVIEPQLATLASEAPGGDDWLHEMKFDGYRILAYRNEGAVTLKSRRGHDWTAKFPGVAAAIAKLPASVLVMDGEVAVPTADGRTSFGALQDALGPGAARGVVYFAFDLLHLDGRDLRRVPLEARKLTLQALLLGAPTGLPIRYSDHVIGRGPAFFEQVRARGLEGIVSKRRSDPHMGGRSPGWLKIKATLQQEFVVGGYTVPEGSRSSFGSLLVGTYEAPRHAGEEVRLAFAGGVGTGLTEATLRDLHARLVPLTQATCPFDPPPDPALIRRRALWVRPELVIDVEFLEWTREGNIRHPSYRGLREDRVAAEVRREIPLAAPSSPLPPPSAPAASPSPAPDVSPSPPAPAAATKGSRTPVILGQRLSNPDRRFYPEPPLTKLDLARYYEAVGATMLPHVLGRPLSLVRCPEGIDAECFYAKHLATGAGSPLGRLMLRDGDGEGKPEPFSVIRDEACLVALAQLGVLEIHTWNSTDERLEHPNRFVMDLDPGPEVSWAEVVEGARLVRDILRAVGLESWVKTTGGKGLHVVVPIEPVFDWAACLALSRAIAGLVVKQRPRHYTTALPKAGREAKILVDFYRNHRGATSVAAFSTRSRPGATVSVPIAWDELSASSKSNDFTLLTVPQRLARLGADPWAGYFASTQSVRPDVARLLAPQSDS